MIGLVTLPAIGLVGGCQTDDEPGFGIRSIDFDGEDTLTLSFTSAVAEPGNVDPNDFRLSAALTYQLTYSYGGTSYSYAGSTYTDLAYVVEYGSGGGPLRMSFTSITPGPSPEQLVLTTALAIDGACEWADSTRTMFEEYAEAYGDDASFEIDLFLHYAAGEVPITAEDGGHALADIGPDWVLSSALEHAIEEFGFPHLRPRLRIPCP
jgi:hypothetical protein